MKFDAPAGANPIDQLKIVGKAIDRIDGPLKTTGMAPYAYERNDVAPDAVYGYIIGSAIPKGRIVYIDEGEALAAPGVLAVITAKSVGKLGKGKHNNADLLAGPEIQHYHQAVALVVAQTFEQARAAAQRVRVEYQRTPGKFDIFAEKDNAAVPVQFVGGPADSAIGDFAGAYAEAPVTLDATYSTSNHSHAMMEPHATTASWEGDKLTLWTSTQMVSWAQQEMAKILGIPRDNIRIDSPYIGGGFGTKLFVRADALLAALGSRTVRRPVKVALQRPLVFNNTTQRAATIQRIRLGATREGNITAIGHEHWSGDINGVKSEAGIRPTRFLYAGDNRMTSARVAALDLTEANAMRAPGETPGSMALEIAMDEMAEKLGLDPIEFRIINDTQVVPGQPGLRFSQRQLTRCLRTGAETFGWHQRSKTPGQVRDGQWLVGIGVAAAFRNSPVTASGARVSLNRHGVVTVETDMTDIGTGSYTIIAQTAAEMMGTTVDKVVVRLGNSDYPVSSGSGGQVGANSSTSGVYAACVKLREVVAESLGFKPERAEFANGMVNSGEHSVRLGEAAANGDLVAEDTIEFAGIQQQYQLSTFGAHFVEVGVDVATAEIRLRRMLAVCASGRILNPKSARSQIIGAMTMGAGAALMEELVVDKQRGFFVNHDLAGYEVPVHADIPHQDVIFLDETDPFSSPMKAKGVGELGICGVGAAIANAIYNATGIRVRDYPITLDKLLDQMPELV